MSIMIYGCVDRDTGAIIFEDAACDNGDYTGCIVRSGEHTGQVAVTVNEELCDDTYYGCIDRDTGKFKVEIPATCCVGVQCGLCKTGRTPKKITIKVSGFVDCPECHTAPSGTGGYKMRVGLAEHYNGNYLLEQVSGNPCKWVGYSPRPVPIQDFYYNIKDNACGTLYQTTIGSPAVAYAEIRISYPYCDYKTGLYISSPGGSLFYAYNAGDDCYLPTGKVCKWTNDYGDECLYSGYGGGTTVIGHPDVELIGLT